MLLKVYYYVCTGQNTAEECSLQPAEGRTIRTFSLKFQRFCPSDNVE